MLVSGKVRTSRPAKRTVVPQTVVGMYHASRPYFEKKINNVSYSIDFYSKCKVDLTKKSTTNGAPIEPMCAIVEHMPKTELRIAVGNSSAVCNVTMEKTALTPKRPNIAIETMTLLYSANTRLLTKIIQKKKPKAYPPYGIANSNSMLMPDKANNKQHDDFLPKYFNISIETA